MSSKQVLLNCFHLIRALINLSHLLEVRLNSSQLFCTPEISYCQREVSCTKRTIGRRNFCTQKLETQMHLNRKAFTKYFVLHYTKACTKHFPPVLLCTTNLAQSTSQYILICAEKLAQSTTQNNFVLQSFHKACPSIYYFVLQSLHTALPSTTLYYKACTKHVPVLLCTTRLAQSTSQYYFVLQGLPKVFPSTTLYYKACTKHVPVLLCSTKRKKYFPVLLCTTSSTAQGGGGSFKNRKPIGEIGCCESGMAERSH